jgi:heme oxygenase
MSTLRELTADSHAKAENTVFMRLLMAKAINPLEYMDYLTQLQLVYNGIEYAANKFGILKDFEGIQRSDKIKADLDESNAINGKRSHIRWSTVAYYNYLIALDDKDKVAAHFYVRFAGDMFGGQMLKSLVPSTGKMYDFDNNLPTLRLKMRELATPNLADEAKIAFNHTIDIVDDVMGVRNDIWP